MLMMPLWMATAMSRPLVTWPWLTLNWLTWLARKDEVASRSYQDGLHSPPSANMIGVTPTALSLARSAMNSAQLTGVLVIPAFANAVLL